MEISELMLYDSSRSLPYQERLNYLSSNWDAEQEEELFDKIRGIGKWVNFPDKSRLFIPRIPFDLLKKISIGKDKFGFDNFREEDCRDLIAREGL
jgi:hypothetical protein